MSASVKGGAGGDVVGRQNQLPPGTKKVPLMLDTRTHERAIKLCEEVGEIAVLMCDERTEPLTSVQQSVRNSVPKLLESKKSLTGVCTRLDDAVYGVTFSAETIKSCTSNQQNVFESVLNNLRTAASIAKEIQIANQKAAQAAKIAQKEREREKEKEATKVEPPPQPKPPTTTATIVTVTTPSATPKTQVTVTTTAANTHPPTLPTPTNTASPKMDEPPPLAPVRHQQQQPAAAATPGSPSSSTAPASPQAPPSPSSLTQSPSPSPSAQTATPTTPQITTQTRSVSRPGSKPTSKNPPASLQPKKF
ncbi:hypothetical protein Pelo_1197 [Pelomyxa schiedti]|nr:hypothetical protein Pelo_1197 [Pelomyxa schiedti]